MREAIKIAHPHERAVLTTRTACNKFLVSPKTHAVLPFWIQWRTRGSGARCKVLYEDVLYSSCPLRVEILSMYSHKTVYSIYFIYEYFR